MKSQTTFLVILLSISMMFLGCTKEELKALEETLEDPDGWRNPDAFPYGPGDPTSNPQLTRISEIIPVDSANSQGLTRFIYEYDTFLGGNYIKYIWDAGMCDNSLIYLIWDDYMLKEAYVGKTGENFNTSSIGDLELFKLEADKWIFEFDQYDYLLKVYLSGNPGTYRRFAYKPDRDFYDSIVDYREDKLYRTLKYQYAADDWTLERILDLDQAGDTTGIYTFEFDYQKRNHPALYESLLIGIPNSQCNFLFLNGSLWAWHLPDPVKKLFKDGVLVYEAAYNYELEPKEVNYSRMNAAGTTNTHSEEVVMEVIQ